MSAIDCVGSYHMNPFTCGVAKFNLLLARRLSVPVVPIADTTISKFARPCLSIKVEEFEPAHVARLWHLAATLKAYDLFLHSYTGSDVETELVRKANKVYAGNGLIGAQLRGIRPEVIDSWCPGTLMDVRPFEETELSVFSFGMAHKVQVERYERLKQLLDQTGRSYSVYLSTAFHEGTTFEGAFADTYQQLCGVFGERLYFLGFLSDMAAYNYLRRCTYFAAFFGSGLRANNTSVNAALEFGVAVVTNLDSASPSVLVHENTVIDINTAHCLPHSSAELAALRNAAREAAKYTGWDRLLESMRAST